MTLPYDIARCPGTTHPTCQYCRRREPGSNLQWLIAPPIEIMSGNCEMFIGQPTYASDRTEPTK